MTVSVIALGEAELSCVTDENTLENFYMYFGTEGCLLYCEQRGQIHSRFKSPAELRNFKDPFIRGRFQKSHEETSRQWFTLEELGRSIKNGCGSCLVIQEILDRVYPSVDAECPQSTEKPRFAISSSFEISRKQAAQDTTKAQIVQLFHPKGFPTRLKWMRTSSFLRGDTASDVSIAKVRRWLEICDTKHLNCYSTDSPLPSRVIATAEIQKGSLGGVGLVETITGELGRYACLSHCWGQTPIACCTTSSNLEQAKQFIDYRTLPKTFIDAVFLTRKLGIPYIWIDSICIIQDGDGGKDWKVEAAKMADVYGRSYLTIAASSSSDSEGGCFLRTNPDLALSISVSEGRPSLIGARICDFQGFLREHEDIKARYPLFQRCWVYQERFLSRRLLKCNLGEFEYQCIKSRFCECGSYTEPLSPHTAMVDSVIPDRRMLLSNFKRNPDLCRIWHNIVSDYMSMNIKYVTDILPAISGCARLLSRYNTKSQYFAGLWHSQLHSDLLWRNSAREPLPRTTWTAPTWSWASLPPGQRLEFLEVPDRCFVDNLPFHIEWTVQCVTVGAHEFGVPSDEEGDCYLESEQSLFPCSLQCLLDCKNGHVEDSQNTYVKGNNNNSSCHSSWSSSQIAVFDFWPDTPYQDLISGTTTAWLLQAARFATRKGKWTDIFIVLKEETAAQTYTRIGLSVRITKTREAYIESSWEIEKRKISKIKIV